MISRIASLVLLWAACSSALGFSVRTASWSEDVRLHDGRLIKVEREVEWTFQLFSGDSGSPGFMNSWPDRFWLKFKLPDSQEVIQWQGEQHFRPVLLDIVNGVPYLIVFGHPTKETERNYGCPELPYIYLQFDPQNWGGWKAIPAEKAPEVLRRANLSPEYPDIGKNHLSTDDVHRLMPRFENSTANNFQQEIPRSYKEWRYSYKNSHLNERRKGDCRPPRTQPPPFILPAAADSSPELLDTIDYMPEFAPSKEERARMSFDDGRAEACKKLFRQTDPDDRMQDQRFVNDATGSKRVPYSKGGQFEMGVRVICDEHVWFVTHMEERGKIVITKFTPTGDLASRIRFLWPQEMQGFVGYISIPSLRSEGGYLYFDWQYFREVEREWRYRRILKMRVREPISQNIGNNR